MSTVLITGGSGLIGTHLCKRLQEQGYDVAILGRKRKLNTAIPHYTWDWKTKTIDRRAIDVADYIIHLAGANIGDKRWTVIRRKLIVDSRVKTAELLFDQVKEQKTHLKAFISASAIGYYGTITSNYIFSESDPPAGDFLGETCRQWEESADRFVDLSIRSVKIRTGVVLTRKGGALSKMAAPVKMGIGSAIGTGGQYLPWIHIDDLCGIYIRVLEDDKMTGPYNAVAPDHKTNEEFTRIMARVLKKPFISTKLPAITMKLMFGKMSEIILKGSRVSSEKIITAGYKFQFTALKEALTNLLIK